MPIRLITGVVDALQRRSAVGKAARTQEEFIRHAADRLEQDTAGVNARILDTEREARDWMIGSAGDWGGHVERTANEGVDRVTGASQTAQDLLGGYRGDALKRLSPYQEGGERSFRTLADLATGDFNRSFTTEDFEADPGYAFRLAEGEKAIQRAAAATGGLASGGTLKALQRYGQGVASQEYQSAFNRFMDQKESRFRMLADVAGFGERAVREADAGDRFYGGAMADVGTRAAEVASNLRMRGAGYNADVNVDATRYAADAHRDAARWIGANTMGTARDIGNLQLAIGDTRAGEYLGKANQWSGMLSSAANFGDRISLGDVWRRRSRPRWASEDERYGG